GRSNAFPDHDAARTGIAADYHGAGAQERTERGREIQYVSRRHAAANDAAQSNVRDAEGFVRTHFYTIAAEGGQPTKPCHRVRGPLGRSNVSCLSLDTAQPSTTSVPSRGWRSNSWKTGL